MELYLKHNEYLEKRLTGEKVISAATLYGIAAMAQTSDHFLVVEINKDNLSFLSYKVEDGKFRVTSQEEGVSHNILSIITEELLNDRSIRKWWKNVFHEHNGKCTYDTYYDSLKIAEGNETSFGEFITQITAVVSAVKIPAITSQVFLTGEMAEVPVLRYVFQQLASGNEVRLLPVLPDGNAIEEEGTVVMPNKELDSFFLQVNGGLKLSMLTLHPATVTLPLHAITTEMVSGTRWEEMLCDEQKDYSVSNYDFKVVSVNVDYDVFQHIFLSCVDSKGNKKVKLIK